MSKIYIITSGFKNNIWLQIQSKYLEKYTASFDDIEVFCGYYKCEQVELPHYTNVDINHMPNAHYTQVNNLANDVMKDANDDDIILFIDCDTLICQHDWDKKVREYLQDHDIVCVCMKENYVGSDPLYMDLPHLCFFATTKKTWVENGLLWDLNGSQNPQAGMKKRIEKAGLSRKDLLRTNKFNVGKVAYGVYDNLLYHQTCAIRGFDKQVYEYPDIYLRNPTSIYKDADVAEFDANIWSLTFEAIKKDALEGSCNFVRRYFMGIK